MTETTHAPLDRDPGQRPPGQRPPGQNPPGTETSSWMEIPPGQRPRPPPVNRITDTYKNITLPQLCANFVFPSMSSFHHYLYLTMLVNVKLDVRW